MFKKLKQKIEEGGESSIDKVAFSPRKLPGSVVRSSSQTEEPQAASSSHSSLATAPQTSADNSLQPPAPATTVDRRESRDEDQGITVESVTAPSVVRGNEQVCSFMIIG